MNLIYICVFHQQSYINLLKLLITSVSVKANIDNKTTDILIMTAPSFEPLIKKELSGFNLDLKYYVLDLNSIFEAGCARLNIFNYENISKYYNILYLDTDILINSDINVLFNLQLSSEKIYALQEGHIGLNCKEFWGGQFFDFKKFDKNLSAFTSGILYFRNSDCMKSLFSTIQSHIQDYIYVKKNQIPVCLDQPFIVYNAISQNKYDNQLLKSYVENNPSVINDNKIIYHFPGGPGDYSSKFEKMTNFWRKMNKINFPTPLDYPNNRNVKDIYFSIPIINFRELINKKYSWGHNTITFLENEIMDAFGQGTYTQQDTYIYQANFGGRIHKLVFNNDYTEFTSTRQDDNLIVKGKLLL